jgi:hypothetical protein
LRHPERKLRGTWEEELRRRCCGVQSPDVVDAGTGDGTVKLAFGLLPLASLGDSPAAGAVSV